MADICYVRAGVVVEVPNCQEDVVSAEKIVRVRVDQDSTKASEPSSPLEQAESTTVKY